MAPGKPSRCFGDGVGCCDHPLCNPVGNLRYGLSGVHKAIAQTGLSFRQPRKTLYGSNRGSEAIRSSLFPTHHRRTGVASIPGHQKAPQTEAKGHDDR